MRHSEPRPTPTGLPIRRTRTVRPASSRRQARTSLEGVRRLGLEPDIARILPPAGDN
jgi:hypothetical protein